MLNPTHRGCCGLDLDDAPARDSSREAGRSLGRGAVQSPRAVPEAGPKSVPGELPRPVDLPRIERAVREILLAIGENPDREGLEETPARVARAYTEIFAGLRQDAATPLARVFRERSDEVVICRDIEFASMCEHHLLPFLGRAHVAYIPGGRQVVGLSKLARTVEVFARRPQVQERLGNQIADALATHLSPRGVLVLIESEHLCMRMRGVNKSAASMVTIASRGVLRDDAARRSEVLTLLRPAAS